MEDLHKNACHLYFQYCQMSIRIKDLKSIVIYSLNKILLSNKNEWTIDVCDNIDESQKPCVGQKKSGT